MVIQELVCNFNGLALTTCCEETSDGVLVKRHFDEQLESGDKAAHIFVVVGQLFLQVPPQGKADGERLADFVGETALL